MTNDTFLKMDGAFDLKSPTPLLKVACEKSSKSGISLKEAIAEIELAYIKEA